MNNETFEYVVADKSSPTTLGESSRSHTDFFELQDDFSALPPEGAEATCIMHRRIDPWVLLNSNTETNPPDPTGQYVIGYAPTDNLKALPLQEFFDLDHATLQDAHGNLTKARNQGRPHLRVLYRPVHPWEEEPGADEAAAAVREHMRAAKEADVATLRRLAFGPLLAGMGRLSDAQLLDEVRDVYATEPTVLALGRVYGRTARPGHHHVFTNAALHFDVDDSTGQWLISQVRLLKRADQWGLLTGNWQRLLSTSPSLGESIGAGQ